MCGSSAASAQLSRCSRRHGSTASPTSHPCSRAAGAHRRILLALLPARETSQVEDLYNTGKRPCWRMIDARAQRRGSLEPRRSMSRRRSAALPAWRWRSRQYRPRQKAIEFDGAASRNSDWRARDGADDQGSIFPTDAWPASNNARSGERWSWRAASSNAGAANSL